MNALQLYNYISIALIINLSSGPYTLPLCHRLTLPRLCAGKSSDVEVENLVQPSPRRRLVWWIWEAAHSLSYALQDTRYELLN